MSLLYVEPFSGLAGDMFLAALLDLADPRFTLEDLRATCDAILPGEVRLEVEVAWRQNLSGRLLTVQTPESERAPHRVYADVERLVRAAGERGTLSRAVQDRALAVFWRIAVAEGRVHGCPPEEIHFHEVGAVDTIVDVVGACVALERLGVTQVASAPPVTGTGTVRCAHGIMPVPAPAVAELVKGREVLVTGGGGERLTPTGAALLVELCPRFGAPGAFAADAIGYGAGHRDPKEGPPNVVRVQLGRVASDARADSFAPNAWQVDVNLDDMTGEELAYVAQHLRDAGALDVWTTAVTMKKGRPGVVLSALCRASERHALETSLFELTTTFGVRWSPRERTECGRRTLEVLVLGASVRVKVRERPERDGASPFGPKDLSAEHDDVARVASQHGLTLREVEILAVEAAFGALEDD